MPPLAGAPPTPDFIGGAVKIWFRDFWASAKTAGREWMADNALTCSAAASCSAASSYPVLLALAPLLIIAVGVMGILYGQGTTDTLIDQAREQVAAGCCDGRSKGFGRRRPGR